MMQHFKLWFKNIVRPTSSVLRVAKRHFIDAVKEEQGAKGDEASLKLDSETGNVSKVVKDFLNFLDEFAKAEDDVVDVQGKVVIAEERTEEDIGHILHWFKQVIADLQNVPQDRFKRPEDKERLVQEFTKMRARLVEHMQENYAELKKQYLLIEQEKVGKTTDIRMITTQMGPLMDSMRELWKLRGEYREVRHEEGDLQKKGHEMDVWLKELFSQQATKARDELLARVNKEEHIMVKEFKEFEEHLHKMVDAYTLIIRVAVQLYVRLEKQENFAELFLEELRKEEFPKHDEEMLDEELDKEKHHFHEEVGDLLEAMQWGRHKMDAAA